MQNFNYRVKVPRLEVYNNLTIGQINVCGGMICKKL